MTRDLRASTGGARGHIVLDESADVGPGILAADKVEGTIPTEMSRERVVVLILQNAKPEVVRVGYVDAPVKPD